MKKPVGLVLLIAAVACGGAAAAQVPAAPVPPVSLAQRAAARFPQPVRVGDLIGRDVLEPIEAPPVLGHVAGIGKRPDGELAVLVRFGGVLGFGGRLIAVPVEATALLGQYMAVMDFTPQQLEAFPTVDAAGFTALPAEATIRVGLVRPFH